MSQAESRIAIAVELAAKDASKDNFRSRIAGHVEKVLATVDNFPLPANDRDADVRLTVLEKAERVGSRGYGLEEKSGVNVLINLNALNSATYDAEAEIPEVGLGENGYTDVATLPPAESD